MKLITNKVHIQGMIVLLADKVHRPCKWEFHTTTLTQAYSSSMADTTIFIGTYAEMVV